MNAPCHSEHETHYIVTRIAECSGKGKILGRASTVGKTYKEQLLVRKSFLKQLQTNDYALLMVIDSKTCCTHYIEMCTFHGNPHTHILEMPFNSQTARMHTYVQTSHCYCC